MPERDTSPTGTPCWIDLTTTDTDRSRAFYTDLFGWTAEDPDAQFGGYFNFLRQGVRTAGCMAAQPAIRPYGVLQTIKANPEVQVTRSGGAPAAGGR